MCKKFMLIALIIFFSVPAFAVDYVPGDVLVVLKPESSENIISASGLKHAGREAFYAASFASSSGAWVKNTYAALSEAGNNIHALIHSDTQTPEELAAELLKNPNVLAASPNYMFRAAIVPDDNYFSQCWGLEYINAPDAWEVSTGSENVYVAVIDSGIDYENLDLYENIDESLSKNFAYGSSYSATDDYGHGTHVAGTIGAVGNNDFGIAGVNWDVKLISLKALDKNGYGSYADVIEAINYVIELIESGVNIRAVNMSLEAYLKLSPTQDNLKTFPLWQAFKALDYLNYAVIVVAAGNEGITIGQATTTRKSGSYEKGSYVYPASFTGINNMISVGAINEDGTLASFSNRGANILAPGVNVVSTWLQSSMAYRMADGSSLRSAKGTSMAAPHVSGGVALLASINPSLKAYQYKQAILEGANNNHLDLMSAVNYLADNANTIPDTGKDDNNYNYTDTPAVEPVIYDDDNNGNNNITNIFNDASVGQCNGAINIFALFFLWPLVKKLMS